jgi:hypothetical protein
MNWLKRTYLNICALSDTFYYVCRYGRKKAHEIAERRAIRATLELVVTKVVIRQQLSDNAWRN